MIWTTPGLPRRPAGSGIALLLMLLAASPTRAEDEPSLASSDDVTSLDDESEAQAEDLSEAPTRGTLAHQHDGWYFRLAAGATYFTDAVESEPLTAYGGGVAQGTLTGMGWAGHAAAGYAVSQGFILGATFAIHYIPSVNAENAVIRPTPFGDVHPVVTFENTTLSLIGPFVDYYPDPGSGFHLQACVGYGVLSMNDGVAIIPGATVSLGDQAGSGVSAMLGGGFDVWIGSQLSLGILVEVMGGFGSGDDSSGTHWNHAVFTPAILLAATYN